MPRRTSNLVTCIGEGLTGQVRADGNGLFDLQGELTRCNASMSFSHILTACDLVSIAVVLRMTYKNLWDGVEVVRRCEYKFHASSFWKLSTL